MLTCVFACWAAQWHCCACPQPPWSQLCCQDMVLHAGGPGAGWLQHRQPMADVTSCRAVHWQWVQEGEHLLKASSIVASESCKALPVGWDVACTSVQLLHPVPMVPRMWAAAGLMCQAPLRCALVWDPCGKASQRQQGDQQCFLIWCQHMLGIPWHHTPVCDGTTWSHLPRAAGQSPCSCCPKDSNTQAAPEGRGTLQMGTLFHQQGRSVVDTPSLLCFDKKK